ncbi:Fur family transcriptional regulator [Coprobacter tertius]|uniref:Transcriptional repressor n=1 Tax=Coprobacter tertius TaxID=2944915 RepID=A0ABT1ME61_9BACT|nr:Fur family transcriptional regulator [Coprobacter tertius]MCP9610902.1 transcriptional repressor [Coprobacter tertius]
MLPHTKIVELFRSRGIKVTPQRVAVYSALTGLKHPCPEDVIGKVKETFPAISTATIYNSLDFLVQKNLIRKVNTADNRMCFDWDMSEHYHIYCADSRKILDFRDEELTRMIREYIGKKCISGFELTDIQLQLVGYMK